MVGFGTVGLSAGGVVERGVAEGAVGDALVAITVKDLSPPVFVAGGTGSGGRHGGSPLPWVWRSPRGLVLPRGLLTVFTTGITIHRCTVKITSLASRVLTGPTANTRAYLLHIQPVLFCPGEHGNETLFPSLVLC